MAVNDARIIHYYFEKKETNSILIAYQTHQPTTDKLRYVKINFFSKPGMVVHA